MIRHSAATRVRWSLMLAGFTLPAPKMQAQEKPPLPQHCEQSLKKLSPKNPGSAPKLCQNVRQLPSCSSVHNEPIFHFERLSEKRDGKKILVFGLIHGDEVTSGLAATAWMNRVTSIMPRNSWRIVPILNPDGFKGNTRTNARGVDLNRNFPTQDWNKNALEYWRVSSNKDPRRNPGQTAASEPETRCAMAQIDDFKPDFIISIHTPYGVLDLDGPKSFQMPKTILPWASLGNYPGSLGRFMWTDKGLPVLTIELTGKEAEARFSEFDRLQDASSELVNKLAMTPRKDRSL